MAAGQAVHGSKSRCAFPLFPHDLSENRRPSDHGICPFSIQLTANWSFLARKFSQIHKFPRICRFRIDSPVPVPRHSRQRTNQKDKSAWEPGRGKTSMKKLRITGAL